MKRIILSTDSVNVHGYRLLSSGCDLSLYIVNPIMLFMHERGNIIGKLNDVRIENGQISGEPVFASTIKGKECKQLYDDGMLNMASVWAEPSEWSEDELLKLPTQTLPTVTKWLLKEVSLVDIAGNRDAVKLVDSDNKELKLSDLTANTNFKLDTNMKKIALFLKLSDSASEDAILEAVQRVHTEHANLSQKLADKSAEVTTLLADKKGLQDSIAARENAEFEQLLNAPERKLTEPQKVTFKKLFAADKESTIDAVKALPTFENLASTGKKLGDDTRKDWTFDDYSRKDSKALEAMKLNEKEAYKTLFKARYGIEPNV